MGFRWCPTLYTDDIEKLIFPKIPNFGPKFPSMGNNMPFIFYNPARMANNFKPKVENIGNRLLLYHLEDLEKMYIKIKPVACTRGV